MELQVGQQTGQPIRRFTSGAQAIRRAMDIVRVIAELQRSGANLSRVARATGLNKTTTFRILRSLTEERLLRYNLAERNYYIGPLAFELGLAAFGAAQVQAAWQDVLDQIARQTGLTTYLVARSDNEGVCLLCVQSSAPLRAVPVEVGQRVPLGVGSSSLALLASLDDDEVERIIRSLGSRLDQFPDGVAGAEPILQRVQLTRQQGFAIGNMTPGITGIGVAIVHPEGMTQLAISVAAPSSFLAPTDVGKIVSILSAAIRRRLGES